MAVHDDSTCLHVLKDPPVLTGLTGLTDPSGLTPSGLTSVTDDADERATATAAHDGTGLAIKVRVLRHERKDQGCPSSSSSDRLGLLSSSIGEAAEWMARNGAAMGRS